MTSVQKYNKKLQEITQPEIDRLKKCENIATEILMELDKFVEIDPCFLKGWQINNIVAKVIRKHYYSLGEVCAKN